jgi:hypothetical protein
MVRRERERQEMNNGWEILKCWREEPSVAVQISNIEILNLQIIFSSSRTGVFGTSEVSKDKVKMSEIIIAGQVYQHYKSKVYKVVYKDDVYGMKPIWARRQDEFLSKVKINGLEVLRFTLLPDFIP